MSELSDAWTTLENAVRVLGPFAGIYFAAKVIIGFQKDLLGSLTEQNKTLLDRVREQDERIEALEDEAVLCERRNNALLAALQRAGIEVRDMPEAHLFDPPPHRDET